MGRLIEGEWHDQWYDTSRTGGRFVREDAGFRNWVTRDGSPGPTGEGGFRAEPGRYHLYVSYACPWASRAMIFRKLKGLEDVIGVSVVGPLMLENGWEFADEPDPLLGIRCMHQLYTRAKPDYTGRVTVPALWDKQRETIVSNESAEVIRMLNSAFDEWGRDDLDFYPEELRDEIDEVNAFVYPHINNGVYRAGFATRQEAYEEAVTEVFDGLDELERRLAGRRYLCGSRLTEADWRLFTTLIRFDPVYVGHFKCNVRCLREYPNLWGYTRELYQMPGIAETVDFDHIKRHYYMSHPTVNPTRIVPAGPRLDLDAPHGRERLEAKPLGLVEA
jgi:putative glutathione S-transferase